jgi:ribose transport system substrate-binding protein
MIRFPEPAVWYRQATVGLALVILAGTGCSADHSSTEAGDLPGAERISTGPVEVRDGSQVSLALVVGGADPFSRPWKAIAQKGKAEFKLGKVTFDQTGASDQTKQNDVIDSLAAKGYNAFGISAVATTHINSTFEDLKAKGLAVGSLASCPAGETNSADFCLSTDVETAAYRAAKATIEAIGGEGTIVHLTGDERSADTQRRIAGVRKAVAETVGKVTELPVITGLDTDQATARKAVADLLASQGQGLAGIVTTAYDPAVAAADGVAAARLPIKVVAIDDDAKVLSGIRSGGIAATVVQNPAGQAYVGGWLLALLGSKQCQFRTPGLVIDSGSFVVTSANVDSYDAERDAWTRQLQQDLGVELACR